MDSYTTLIAKRKYDTVLLLSEKDDSTEASFARVEAYYGLGKLEYALKTIEERKETLLPRRVECIRFHIDLLLQLERYEEAEKEREKYDELPYFSYEVEELLKELKTDISHAKEQKGAYHHLNVDEIRSYLLNPKSEGETLFVLDALKTMNVHLFMKEVQKFLLSSQNDSLKTYLLLILVDQKVMEEITIEKHGVLYSLVPYELDPPFQGRLYQQMLLFLKKGASDPSILHVAHDLLNAYILEIYPEAMEEEEIPTLLPCFIYLGYRYLAMEKDEESFAKEFSLEVDKFHALLEDIEEKLERTPRLSL